jgi:pyrophosphatase PpaX
VKALLWDLDDTLLDTLEARVVALTHAYESYVGGQVDARAIWRALRGRSLSELGRDLLGDDYLSFTEAYDDHYHSRRSSVGPFPGIPELLEWCERSGLLLAIVTSRRSWDATEELQRSGLLKHFHAVVAWGDADLHKPDPAPVFAALDRLMVNSPEDAAFIGNSPSDIKSAKSAGCLSIAALWGTLDEELLLDAGPEARASSPTEIPGLIKGEVPA